jgi:DNA-binding transcriptional LysR family regulator
MLQDFSDTLAFVRVVQHGGFTAAARVLEIPKSRLSRKVQDLEARLGVTLLKRSTRRLGLTEAGSLFYEQCAPLMASLLEAEQQMGTLGDHPRGLLTITAPFWLASGVLAPLLTEFLLAFPDIQLNLLLTHDPLDLVSSDVDLAFRLWTGDLPNSQLAARRLAGLPLRLYAGSAYLARRGAPDGPETLIDHATLAIHTPGAARPQTWWLTDDQVAAEFPIRPAAVATDPEVLSQMMLNGGGLLLATELQMRGAVSAGDAHPVLADWRGREAGLYAVMPPGRVQPPKVGALIAFLKPRLRLGSTS